MTSKTSISALKEVMNRVRRSRDKRLDNEKPVDRWHHIPDAHQLVTVNVSIRAERYFQKHIQPVQDIVEELTAHKKHARAARKEGHAEAGAMIRELEAEIKALKWSDESKMHWEEWQLIKGEWEDEGLSEEENRVAWGAVCGRYFRYMKGVGLKQPSGFVDSKTITIEHCIDAAEQIQAKIDLAAHKGGEGGDTCEDYLLNKGEDLTQEDKQRAESKAIASATEKDTSELLQEEWAAKDAAQAALEKAVQARGKMTIRKKVSA